MQNDYMRIMIKYIGSDKAGNEIFTLNSTNYRQLFYDLVSNGYIQINEFDPFEISECLINGYSYSQIKYNDDTYIYQTLSLQDNWQHLSDDDIKKLILHECNAFYYQEFNEVYKAGSGEA